METLAGTWLEHASRALEAIIQGSEPEDHLAAAARLDEQATAVFLCVGLAAAGQGDRIHASWLAAAFGSLEGVITRGQRAAWTAAAQGAFGPAGRIFLLQRLTRAAPALAPKRWLDALTAPSSAPFPATRAAHRLADLRARVAEITEPVPGPAPHPSVPAPTSRCGSHPTPSSIRPSASLAATPSPPGATPSPPGATPSPPGAQLPASVGAHPASRRALLQSRGGEVAATRRAPEASAGSLLGFDGVRPIREASVTESPGSAVPPDFGTGAPGGLADEQLREPLALVTDLLLDDLRPGADPALAAVALGVAASSVRAAAEQLVLEAREAPAGEATVEISGFPVIVRISGPVGHMVEDAQQAIVTQGLPSRRRPWAALIACQAGLAIALAGAVLTLWPIAGLGTAVALAGLATLLARWRADRRRSRDVAARAARVRDEADAAVEALKADATEADQRATQAVADLAEISLLLRAGPRASA